MPLYEYKCNICNFSFEELIRNKTEIEEVTCPGCGEKSTSKKISTFATKLSISSLNSSGNSNLTVSSCSGSNT
ncbi:zinc ribbon domain-containing protein [Chloroflexota bacterium]